MIEGGTASGTIVNAGGSGLVFGGLSVGTTVNSGGTELLETGGTA